MVSKILLLISCLSLCSISTSFARETYQYAITGSGISYYSDAPEILPTLTTRTQHCRELSKRYRDPAGGRGIFVEECSSYKQPIAVYKTRTFDVSTESWSQCTIQSRKNKYVYLLCPKLYRD